MVALPLDAEQPANARRLVEPGVGLVVSTEEANAVTLAAACQRVLDNPVYRQVARGFQRRILGLPGIDSLVADLTTLTSPTPSASAGADDGERSRIPLLNPEHL